VVGVSPDLSWSSRPRPVTGASLHRGRSWGGGGQVGIKGQGGVGGVVVAEQLLSPGQDAH